MIMPTSVGIVSIRPGLSCKSGTIGISGSFVVLGRDKSSSIFESVAVLLNRVG